LGQKLGRTEGAGSLEVGGGADRGQGVGFPLGSPREIRQVLQYCMIFSRDKEARVTKKGV